MFLDLVLRLAKFLGVLAYAGGLVGAFVASAPAERKRAVHSIASPALVCIWAVGYALSARRSVPLTELWVLGGLLLSAASLLALIQSVTRGRPTMTSFCAAALPLVGVLVFMVFKPTWAAVRGTP